MEGDDQGGKRGTRIGGALRNQTGYQRHLKFGTFGEGPIYVDEQDLKPALNGRLGIPDQGVALAKETGG